MPPPRGFLANFFNYRGQERTTLALKNEVNSHGHDKGRSIRTCVLYLWEWAILAGKPALFTFRFEAPSGPSQRGLRLRDAQAVSM
jgi:hypothetical protein